MGENDRTSIFSDQFVFILLKNTYFPLGVKNGKHSMGTEQGGIFFLTNELAVMCCFGRWILIMFLTKFYSKRYI